MEHISVENAPSLDTFDVRRLKQRERSKRFRERNPERMREHRKKWRLKNPGYGKKHYQENKPEYIAKANAHKKKVRANRKVNGKCYRCCTRAADLPSGSCSVCHQQHLKRERLRRKNQPERIRDSYLKNKYGISLKEYLVKLEQQKGVCAICGKAPQPSEKTKGDVEAYAVLAVDHDHVTGTVRGLLCRACNTAIGFFEDRIEIMRSAISYLEQHSESFRGACQRTECAKYFD